MDKMSIEKSNAINNLMKKLAEGEKSAKENGWSANNETLSAITEGQEIIDSCKNRFDNADEMFADLNI